jgi:hypothetical protein
MDNSTLDLKSLARTLPVDSLPDFVGELAAAQATAIARLVAPVQNAPVDSLVTVEEGAPQLAMSAKYIYEHVDELPFVRKIGSRSIRLSTLGIQQFLRRRAR